MNFQPLIKNSYLAYCCFYLAGFFCDSAIVNGQCSTGATSFFIQESRPNSLTFWRSACCISDTIYYECGPVGFTPGVDANPGSGGIITKMHYNPPDTAFNLQPDTYYDIYIRQHCSNGSWSVNNVPITCRTLKACSNLNVITNDVPIHCSLDADSLVWECFTYTNLLVNNEKIYQFNTINAVNYEYIFFAPGIMYGIDVAYQNASSCNENDYHFLPMSRGVVNLQPWSTYYFMFAMEQLNTNADIYFKISAIDTSCPLPVPTVNVLPSNAEITYSNSNYYDKIEYGPSGFIPGSLNIPGYPNGQVSNLGNGFINNLQPFTYYDYYIKRYCSSLYTQYASGSFFTPSCHLSIPLLKTDSSIYVHFKDTDPDYFRMCQYIYTYSNGPEESITLAPQEEGYYEIIVGDDQINLALSYKPHTSNCDKYDYTCLAGYSNGNYSTKYYCYLNDSTSYDFLLDEDSSHFTQWPSINVPFSINCPKPSNVTISHATPSSLTVNWNCINCHDTIIMEYGFHGFVPGKSNTAGISGNLIINPVPPYFLSGLLSDSIYDFYLRTACGGNYSPNVFALRRTMKNCNQDTLHSGEMIGYSFDFQQHPDMESNPIGTFFTNCGGTYDLQEQFYQFTPIKNNIYGGMYFFFKYNNNYNHTDPILVTYRPDSLSCSDTGWICGGVFAHNNHPFVGDTVIFGPLDSGITYSICLDGYGWSDPNMPVSFTYYIKFLDLSICQTPTTPVLLAVTPNSGTVKVNNSYNFLGDVFMEYGPKGFQPGIDSMPGINGAIIHPIAYPQIISNLNPGDSIDVYIRSFCDSSAGFSGNSQSLLLVPCSSPPSGIASSTGTTLICTGDTISLYRLGGILSIGTSWIWYQDSCCNGSIGSGDSISLVLNQNRKVYVRSEGTCGISAYSLISLQVSPSLSIGGNTVICTGDSNILTAIYNYGNYQWSNGSTTKTIWISNSGIYTLTVTDSSGCVLSDTILLIDKNKPQPTITGTFTICTGDTAWLDAGAGFYCYNWSNGSTDQITFALQPGNYIVQVCDSGSVCQGNDTTTVVVNALPVPVIFGDTIICQNDSSLLSVQNIGLGYVWSNGSTTNQIYASTAGAYSVLFTDSNGCAGSSSVQLHLSKHPVSLIAPAYYLCPGDSLLIDAGPGFISYSWSNGSSASYIYLSQGGYFHVTVTDSNSCSFTTSFQVTFVNPTTATITASGPTTFCQGQSVLLSVPLNAGYQYQWLNNSNVLVGEVSQQYNATSTGNYYVSMQDNYGCISSAGPVYVLVNCILPPFPYNPGKYGSDDLLDEISFEIFPNPVNSNYFNLKYNVPEDGSFKLINQVGMKVMETRIKAGRHEVRLQVSAIEDGVYSAILIYKNERIIKRLILMK
jgi:hypothetical protein